MAKSSGHALILSMVVGLGLFTSAGCQESDAPCTRSPTGEVTVFLEGESGSLTFKGTVETIGSRSGIGLRSYRIRDEAGSIRTLVFGAPVDSLPVELGVAYEFQVETVPGMPTPNSLLIREDGRFHFAAASDFAPGERVFQVAPAGFEILLEKANCADRGVNPCYASEVNGQLVCSRKGESIRLFHGESEVVDGVWVTCFAARLVEYSDTCADAGAFGISYMMQMAIP